VDLRADNPADERRRQMVESQVAARGVRDPRVLAAMNAIPREKFVPAQLAAQAYEDRALAVGMGQTISQPYIVGWMSESLHVEPGHRILEIGTGTGYQTAILAMLGGHVYSMERIESLSLAAQDQLRSLGVGNVTFRIGDGSLGWPEEAPFDRIMVTAAAPKIVQQLFDQLTEGGRMVIPVGDESLQQMKIVERVGGRLVEEASIAVRFVKLVGQAAFKE
jgi:protein-L-isoaspartate(D-aspartate) O-methyltransferase